MFIISDGILNWIIFKISLLSFFIYLIKCLIWVIKKSFCKIRLKFTFFLIKNCQHNFFVIKVRKRFSYLWSSSINYSHFLPYLSRDTDKIRELNKSFFELIILLTLNTIIVNRLHKILVGLTCKLFTCF